jgi:iron-sulfur cluster repair protein YtfE (RIC family)
MKPSDFSAETSVNEIIRRFPSTLPVFARYGLDTCCMGALPLAESALKHDVEVEALLDEVRTVAAGDR